MLNSVNLQARLVKDVELFTNPQKPEAMFASMRVATESVRTNKAGETSPIFIDCVIFGKSAEACAKYLHKGNQVLITGSLSQRTYTNKNNQQVTTTEIIVDRWAFCEPKAAEEAPAIDTDEIPDPYEPKKPANPQPTRSGYTKR